MKLIHAILDKVGVPVLTGVFTLLFILEMKYPLRRRVQPRLKRTGINGVISFPSFVVLRLLFIPALVWIALRNRRWQFGFNYLYERSACRTNYLSAGRLAWLKFIAGFILLDYFVYIWHLLNHRIPFLWRFHHVHHTDLDLDVTTAIRFHFGELLLSIFFRGAAVLLTGASPLLVLVYEILFEAETSFHHSNWKLPIQLERILNKLIVTPRMHGIHHSIVKDETDSNFATIFSFWDRLHGTIRLNIPQKDIIIGIPSYQDPSELTIWNLLIMPFKKTREWENPDGSKPLRLLSSGDKEKMKR